MKKKRKERIVKLFTQTSHYAPSQWEGRFKDDRWFYVRNRGDVLTVGIGETLSEAIVDTVFRSEDFNSSGFDTETMQAATAHILDW